VKIVVSRIAVPACVALLLTAGRGGTADLPDVLQRHSPHFDKPGGPGRPDFCPFQGLKGAPPGLAPFRTGDPKAVMPVGAGDFSAMVSFGENELHLHLGKTDFLAFTCGGGLDLVSPGHLTVRFSNLKLADIKTFDQCMNLADGAVTLDIATAAGKIRCEIAGDRPGNALLIDVADSRPNRGETLVLYDNWRADPANYKPVSWMRNDIRTNMPGVVGARVGVKESTLWFEQRVATDSGGRKPGQKQFNPKTPAGRAYAVAVGSKAAGTARAVGTDAVAFAVPVERNGSFVVAAVCVAGRDADPLAKAEGMLSAVLAADPAARRERRLAWWREFWDQGHLDLRGDKRAEFLARCWYANLYSYASVAPLGSLPPKFNGGPGLVYGDMRPWGMNVWWQNTREMIWPMGAANHLEFARQYLDFYDDCLAEVLASTRDGERVPGAHLPETIELLWCSRLWAEGVATAPRIEPFAEPDPAVIQAFLQKRLDRKGQHTSHIYSSAAELAQQMFDYVQFSGDREFLRKVAGPWLREAAMHYLYLLIRGDDGKYHVRCTNANETWLKIDDSAPDLCAAGYCFGMAIRHGRELGFDPAFIAACAERLDHLAPLPTANAWTVENGKVATIEAGGKLYLPGALKLGDGRANFEDNEMYVVFPFAMDRSEQGGVALRRAVATDAHRLGGVGGWHPAAIDAARLCLAELAAERAYQHMGAGSPPWPYGGGHSPGGGFYSGAGVTTAPMFDGSCVAQTALQEMLLQSHAPEPSGRLLTGGPIRLLPATPPQWSGSFKLRARGGFVVEADFDAGKVTRARIACERGGPMTLVNPFDAARVTADGAPARTISDKQFTIETKPGEPLTVTKGE